MQIGNIYQNLSAGFETYLVYTGERASCRDTEMWVIVKHGKDWKLSKGVFNVQTLTDNEHCPLVGHIDLGKARDRFITSILERVEIG